MMFLQNGMTEQRVKNRSERLKQERRTIYIVGTQSETTLGCQIFLHHLKF